MLRMPVMDVKPIHRYTLYKAAPDARQRYCTATSNLPTQRQTTREARAAMTPCSGHGAQYNFSGRSLCTCDDEWSGAADMFDQVVARLGDGKPLFLDCLVPTEGVRAAVRFRYVVFSSCCSAPRSRPHLGDWQSGSSHCWLACIVASSLCRACWTKLYASVVPRPRGAPASIFGCC